MLPVQLSYEVDRYHLPSGHFVILWFRKTEAHLKRIRLRDRIENVKSTIDQNYLPVLGMLENIESYPWHFNSTTCTLYVCQVAHRSNDAQSKQTWSLPSRSS